MKIKSSIISIIAVVFLSVSYSFSATYYVKNGGNDALSGIDDANAWETIAKVITGSTSGDTVYFKSTSTWTGAAPVLSAEAGVTYIGNIYGGTSTRAILRATSIPDAFQAVVAVSASDQANPVSFVGFEVDGNGQSCGGIYVSNYYSSVDVSYVTIDDCLVYDVGVVDAWVYGISLSPMMGYSLSNVTLTDTTVHDTVREGIVIYPGWSQAANQCDNITVSRCTVYNAGTTNPSFGIGIQVKGDADEVIIDHCYIHNNASHGIAIETDASYPADIPGNQTIRYNLVYDNNGTGIVFNNPANTQYGDSSIYGNIVFNNKRGAGGFGGELIVSGNNYGSMALNIYQNTFYSTESLADGPLAVHLGSDLTHGVLGTPTIRFKNNIVYTDSYACINDPVDILSGNHSDNLVFRASADTDDHVLIGATTYDRDGTASDLTNWEATALKVDPLLVSPTTNFHLQFASTAKAAGTNLGSPYNVDYDGRTLPTSYGYPIGAYGYYTGSSFECTMGGTMQ